MHRLTKNTKLIQKALLVKKHQVLLLRRSPNSKTRAGKWDLPGGNSEWPQVNQDLASPHESDLLREIKEETGLAVDQFWQERHQPLYFNTYFEVQPQVFSVIVVWRIDLPTTFRDTVKLSHEHLEFAWVDLVSTDRYDFGFAGEPGGFIYESIKNLKAKIVGNGHQ